jgi:hypothetical protein
MLAFAVALAGCDSGTVPTDPNVLANQQKLDHAKMVAALDAVRAGNQQSIIAAPSLVPAGVPLAPFIEARLYAVTNIAMHDALNSVIPRFARYADNGAIVSDANAAAAVLTAAHDAIVGADVGATAATDSWYALAMTPLAGVAGLANGIALGHRTAAAILAMRATDGVAA